MITTYERIYAAWLTPERRAMTCGYHYVVRANGMAHTAFVTRAGLDRWMRERGLSLAGPLDKEGDWSDIVGSYRTKMHYGPGDVADFAALEGERTRAMSNGDWVEAVITHDADGFRTVHTLNPNVRERKVFDYRESERMMQ